MIVKIANGDITEYHAEALIYSTNKDLFLSGGGVGAALIEKYGYDLQDKVIGIMRSQGKTEAAVGDVYDCCLPDMPWKKILHTLVSDENYNTKVPVVKQVLSRCIEACEESSIRSVVVSALGCGYGDLSHASFVRAVKEVAAAHSSASVKEIVICCKNLKFYNEMRSVC